MNSTADEIGSIDCYDYERKGPSNSGQNTFRQMDTDTANGGGGGGPLANGLLLGIAITYWVPLITISHAIQDYCCFIFLLLHPWQEVDRCAEISSRTVCRVGDLTRTGPERRHSARKTT